MPAAELANIKPLALEEVRAGLKKLAASWKTREIWYQSGNFSAARNPPFALTPTKGRRIESSDGRFRLEGEGRFDRPEFEDALSMDVPDGIPISDQFIGKTYISGTPPPPPDPTDVAAERRTIRPGFKKPIDWLEDGLKYIWAGVATLAVIAYCCRSGRSGLRRVRSS